MSVNNPMKTPDVEVLLAGSEPELLDSLRTMLQNEAYRLIIALNREEAWRIIYERQPIVTVLTGSDILSLCRKIKNDSAVQGRTHLLVVSVDGALNEIFQAGADDAITGSFDATELRGRVAVGVRSQTMRRQLTAAQEDLERMALSDGLTGIYNHRYFRLRLEQEVAMAHRHDNPLSLMMLDVDAFKNYNDLFGHEAGNQALKWLAQYIAAHVRTVDVAARYGGEEFCIILPMTHSGAVTHIADRLRLGIEADSKKAGLATAITVSIGAARLAIGETGEELIRRADHALYVAKRAGRNRCVMADTYGEQAEIAISTQPEESYNILLVEDDVALNRLLVKRLQKAGHCVLAAEDGVEGLDLFQKHQPEVIVTDWMMPQMDGLELCRQIRRSVGPYAYILLLTAKDAEDNKLEGFHSGVDDYLTKPFNEHEMLARIEVGLRLVRALRKALIANERLTKALQQNQALESENLRLIRTESIPEIALDVSREIGLVLRLIQKATEEIAHTATEQGCQHNQMAGDIRGWVSRGLEACQYLQEKQSYLNTRNETAVTKE